MVSEVEGKLIIFMNDKIIFNEDNILLIEFYQAISSWFHESPSGDFYYDSMDYEDSPILHTNTQDNVLSLSSVWMHSPVTIKKHTFMDAISAFLSQFESEFPNIKRQ